ncbi:MAG: 16S rRNA pseudouridine(516) synthase [Alcanivorax sp.]|nr:16S rRNA pseudouridine(516) synthase [Alcanivorax sp.]
MPSKYARLDRFLCQHLGLPRKAVQQLLAARRVQVDGNPARDGQSIIGPFSTVTFDDRILQDTSARYIMLHKPAGVVSATRDTRHTTVLDLLNAQHRSHGADTDIDTDRIDNTDLHIAGRLDFNSTGLLLLTNDGRWSRHLSAPENQITKRYRVTVEKPLTEEYVHAFAAGMPFAYENITLRPVTLTLISDHIADITLTEGRYHQIKRMFGRFQNKVLTLHRYAIGNLHLDPALPPGSSKPLTKE